MYVKRFKGDISAVSSDNWDEIEREARGEEMGTKIGIFAPGNGEERDRKRTARSDGEGK